MLQPVLWLVVGQYRQLTKAKKVINALLPSKQKNQSGNISQTLGLLVTHVRKKIQESKNLRQDAETENKAIAYNHKKLRSVLEVFPEGVVILDQAGTATLANEKLQSLMGVATADVVGKQPHDWSCE